MLCSTRPFTVTVSTGHCACATTQRGKTATRTRISFFLRAEGIHPSFRCQYRTDNSRPGLLQNRHCAHHPEEPSATEKTDLLRGENSNGRRKIAIARNDPMTRVNV